MKHYIKFYEELLFEDILLLEDKVEFLLTRDGDKLLKTSIANKEKYNSQKDVIDALSKLDPTKKLEYLNWIVRMYLKNEFTLLDTSKIQFLLNLFVENKQNMKNKDLNSYNTLSSLETQTKVFIDDKEMKQKEFDEDKEIKVIVNTPELKVFIPLTHKASCKYGVDTKWCTADAEKYPEKFEEYSNTGNLYIFMLKDRKFQFYYDDKEKNAEEYYSQEFKNELNKEMSFKEFELLLKTKGFKQFTDYAIKKYSYDLLEDTVCPNYLFFLYDNYNFVKNVSETVCDTDELTLVDFEGSDTYVFRYKKYYGRYNTKSFSLIYSNNEYKSITEQDFLTLMKNDDLKNAVVDFVSKYKGIAKRHLSEFIIKFVEENN